jgi:hypothetical protein
MIKDCTNNWTSTLIDVKPLLGDRFYFDLINNLDKKISTIIRWLCIHIFFGIMHDGIKAL